MNDSQLFTVADEDVPSVFLAGPLGCGKTTILANWMNKFKNSCDVILPINLDSKFCPSTSFAYTRNGKEVKKTCTNSS